jgi:hypothetical protein
MSDLAQPKRRTSNPSMPLRSFRLRWQPWAILNSPADVASFLLSLLSFGVACGLAATLAIEIRFANQEKILGASHTGFLGFTGQIIALVAILALLGWIVRSMVVIHLRLCGELNPSHTIKSTEPRSPGLWDHDVDGPN